MFVCVCTHMCSSLPASGTSAWDPSVGACLLTSPEVTCRAVTHSASAPTCPRSCPEPPSPGQGEGTGQPVPGAWVLPAMGARSGPLSGRWVAAQASAPLGDLWLPLSAAHTDLGKRQLIFVMRFPPLLRGFCLINLWNSSLSYPQTRLAGREFTSWRGKLRQGARLRLTPTPAGHSCLSNVPGPRPLFWAWKGPGRGWRCPLWEGQGL